MTTTTDTTTIRMMAWSGDHRRTNRNANSSRLLRKVKPVVERIRELQGQALARLDRKLDISRERVGRNLDAASRMATEQGNPQAIVASETAIAKVFGLAKLDDQYNPTDYNNAKSMTDLGRMLLQSVGVREPSPSMINLAVEANDAFVAKLEEIAQGE